METIELLRKARDQAITASLLYGDDTRNAFYTIADKVTLALLHMQVKREHRGGWGIKFNKYAWWLGAHYSEYNKRLCITVLPCVTLFIVFREE